MNITADTYQRDRTRVIIDLGAIRHNYEMIRKAFPGVLIMSVLKADAYGHGISGIAAGCDQYTDQFAVATVEEGRRIREAGAKKPVLLLGPVPEGRITEAAKLGLAFSVGSLAYALRLKTELEKEGLQADIHIKIDTGFNRTGFRFREAGDGGRPEGSFVPTEDELMMQQLKLLFQIPQLKVKGIYTHLPVPESDFQEDVAFTDLQLARFGRVIERLKEAGLDPGVVHALSTGGALARPGDLFDMVRIGMMIYGQCDSLQNARKLGLRQAMQWSSQLVAVEEVAEGESVGYGRTFIADRPLILGVVSVGYADGYRRNYQGLEVLCGGKKVPVIGRICMDFLMIDLTEVDEPEVGMQVVLLGSMEGEDGERLEITAIEIAAAADSTCGEVTAAISPRVPRYYT